VWSATSISSSIGDEVRLEMAAASGVIDDVVLQWFGRGGVVSGMRQGKIERLERRRMGAHCRCQNRRCLAAKSASFGEGFEQPSCQNREVEGKRKERGRWDL
jgi:hypothetical protein